MSYPIFAPFIVIDSTNNAIRMKENSTLGGTGLDTVEVAVGVYTLPELLDELVVAFNSHANVTNANTYSASFGADPDPANKSAIVQFSKSGGSSFQFLWDDAATTFDAALIGFDPDSHTLFDQLGKINTLSPSSIWVSPAIYVGRERQDDQDAWSQRMLSGGVDGGSLSDLFDELRLDLAYVDERRTHHAANSADPDAAFSRMLQRLKRGRGFELHFVDLSSGVIVNPLTDPYEDAWVLSDDAAKDKFDPERHFASSLYRWDLVLWRQPQ